MGKKIVLTAVTMALLLLTPMVAFVIQPVSAQPTIKVGVLVPYRLVQGDAYTGGAEGGAELAARDINAAGGIDINGTKYLIELVKDPATGKFYDEHAFPLDTHKAYLNTKALLAAGCKFIIGGFRTECTWEIMRAIAEHNEGKDPKDWVIYLINGAATDDLCIEAKCREMTGVDMSFAWRFRVNPINSTMLFRNVLGWLQGYLLPKKLIPMYGTVKFGCIAEDLEWTRGISWYFANVGLGPNTTHVWSARSPPGTMDFTPYLEGFKAAGAHLVCHFYTLPDAQYLVKQWYEGRYKFLLVGIDVFGQSAVWPSLTGGACEYEMTQDFAGTRTPITPEAVTFWDNFVGNFTAPGGPPAWPVYTAWGAYNAFLSMKASLETADTLDSTRIIETLQTQDIWVLNGKAKFTTTNDVFSNEFGPIWTHKYTRAFYVQWIKKSPPPAHSIGGFVKEVVSPVDQPYSRKARIPPWIHPLGDWDLNLDGKVDIEDVARVSKAFGTLPGEPRWDVECDVNLDGRVDIKDVAAVSKNFGRFVSPWPP